MFSGDFVRLDEEAFKQGSTGAGADWSDQETLLLLEGVEMYDDDWQAVAEHIGTRSKEQCIGKFLQLPIEDPYMTSDPAADLGPLRYQAGMNGLPFEGTENPVMSVVTFLASAVGPAVAAAAAQGALGEFSKGLKRKRDDKAETDGDNASKSLKATTDAMEVDGEESKVDDAAPASSAVNGESPAPSKQTIEQAASIALGAAAVKAKALAAHEESRLSQLVSRLVAAQVRKVELKLSMFEKMEEMLEEEKRKVELERQEVFKEKVNYQKKLDQVEALIVRAREEAASLSAADVTAVKAGQTGQSTAEQVKPVLGVSAPPREEGQVAQL